MVKSENDIIYWLWLQSKLGTSIKNISDILEATHFDPFVLYDIENQSNEVIDSVLTKYQKEKISDKNLDEEKRIADYCFKNNIEMILPFDEKYPKMLLRIENFPAVLYCKGDASALNSSLSVSIVGTRQTTEHGRRLSYEMGFDLGKAGFIVTSGMALGVDSFAHMGAIDAEAKTIAVLGSGIDIIYPKQNIELYELIQQHGAVITEFAPGTTPYPKNFPTRNRIVSGLSVGTLVIEAGVESGSLNTAGHAEAQGRDIFTIPGAPGEYSTMGSNDLIKSGANVVLSSDDIINYYVYRYGFSQISQITKSQRSEFNYKGYSSHTRRSKKHKNNSSQSVNSFEDNDNIEPSKEILEQRQRLNTDEKIILEVLDNQTLYPDEVCKLTGIDSKNLLKILSLLEIKGLVNKNSEGKFSSKKQ